MITPEKKEKILKASKLSSSVLSPEFLSAAALLVLTEGTVGTLIVTGVITIPILVPIIAGIAIGISLLAIVVAKHLYTISKIPNEPLQDNIYLQKKENFEKQVDILIRNTENINNREELKKLSEQLNSKLLDAVSEGYEEAANNLIKTGANIYIKDQDGQSLLELAYKNNLKKTVSLIKNEIIKRNKIFEKAERGYLPTEEINQYTTLIRSSDGNNILHYSSLSCLSFQIFKSLLENHIDIEARNKWDHTPLHWAVYENKFQASTTDLLENQVDVNAKSIFNETPLHFAAYMCSNRVVPLLIGPSTDVNAVNKNMRTPLHMLTIRKKCLETQPSCRAEIMDCLIEAKAKVNVKDKHGNTPLHYAALSGCFSIVQKLLKNGADINELNNEGKDALQFLKDNKPSLWKNIFTYWEDISDYNITFEILNRAKKNKTSWTKNVTEEKSDFLQVS